MHWGIEYNPAANANQKKIGRWLCDNGADIVVGAHPHCTQPIEKYNGKYICYSLGNSLFTNHTGDAYYNEQGKPFYTRTTRWIKSSRNSFAVVYEEQPFCARQTLQPDGIQTRAYLKEKNRREIQNEKSALRYQCRRKENDRLLFGNCNICGA